MIAIHQIATREKKGGPRIIIPAGSRFDSADYPMISDKEWEAMYKSTPPIIRHPDDLAFSAPAAQQAESVTEGRSPRTDLASQAARAVEREDDGEGEGDGDDAGKPRRRQRAADDEV